LPSLVKPQLTEYKEENSTFLTYESLHKDVFMVVDNTNWYAAVTFNQSKEAGAASKKDVAFNLKVTNNFEANKGFQFLFAGFLAILGVLILTLIITCGCLCY